VNKIGTQRSFIQQIVSAARLVFIGLFYLVVLFCLLAGLSRMPQYLELHENPRSLLMGCTALIIGVIALFWSAPKWSPWASAVAFLVSAKAVVGLVAGVALMPPYRPVSRLIAAEAAAYLISAGILLLRFSTRPPSKLDRVALVVFVLATCADILFEPAHLMLLIGFVALLAARLYSHWSKPGHQRLPGRRSASPSGQT